MKLSITLQFEEDLQRIEDHIFSTTNDLKFIEKFLTEVDEAVLWINTNVSTPKLDETGDRSWPFYRDNKGELRYRIKYLYCSDIKTVFLKRVIDNREQNLEIYPSHKLDTYSGDEE